MRCKAEAFQHAIKAQRRSFHGDAIFDVDLDVMDAQCSTCLLFKEPASPQSASGVLGAGAADVASDDGAAVAPGPRGNSGATIAATKDCTIDCC